MRRLRPRFTVRGMMVAVALVATALSVAAARRSRRFADLAAAHARAERFYREQPALRARFHREQRALSLYPGMEPEVDPPFITDALRVMADHHAEMARRYAAVARDPWRRAPEAAPEPDWDAMMRKGDFTGLGLLSIMKPEPD